MICAVRKRRHEEIGGGPLQRVLNCDEWLREVVLKRRRWGEKAQTESHALSNPKIRIAQKQREKYLAQKIFINTNI